MDFILHSRAPVLVLRAPEGFGALGSRRSEGLRGFRL